MSRSKALFNPHLKWFSFQINILQFYVVKKLYVKTLTVNILIFINIFKKYVSIQISCDSQWIVYFLYKFFKNDFLVDKKRKACKNTANFKELIDLVSAKPVLWNHTLSVKLRNNIFMAKAWKEIASHFSGEYPFHICHLFLMFIIFIFYTFLKGWTVQYTAEKYKQLRNNYLGRRTHLPSGSAARAKKPSDFDDSFHILQDIVKPGE